MASDLDVPARASAASPDTSFSTMLAIALALSGLTCSATDIGDAGCLRLAIRLTDALLWATTSANLLALANLTRGLTTGPNPDRSSRDTMSSATLSNVP